ncbi:MAG: hypothetical protein UHO63_02055 [Blautia sp.]|nr:hypothetical protein [Blautia sp.]
MHSQMRMRTGRHLRSKGHEVSRRLMSDRFGTQSVTAAKLEGLSFVYVVLKV